MNRTRPLRGVDFRLMQRNALSRQRQRQGMLNYKAFIEKNKENKSTVSKEKKC